jgi:hypothetical protein
VLGRDRGATHRSTSTAFSIVLLLCAGPSQVVPHLEDVTREQTQKWIDFCRRNREHALGKRADEELRLVQERLRQREKDEWDNWEEES